jgi:hypothetical protein
MGILQQKPRYLDIVMTVAKVSLNKSSSVYKGLSLKGLVKNNAYYEQSAL